MSFVRLTLSALVVVTTCFCSEPENRITQSAASGHYELVLEAKENHVRLGADLPVLVRLRRLPGAPVNREVAGDISFVVNNGSISPKSMEVFLAAADTVLEQAADMEFAEWVVFTAPEALFTDSRGNSSGISTAYQGEIHALFEDVQAIYKVRLDYPPLSL